MNKKLMAFAVAAAFAAPMVANADSGNVVIYGKIEGSYDYVNTSTSGNDKLNRVSSNSSFVGFKGAEDLGNGLSAIWQVENQVAIDNGGGTSGWNSRNTFIGLSSKSMGTFLAGNHDTPYKLGTNKLNVFGDSMGNYTSIIGSKGNAGVAAPTAGTANVRDLRLANVLAYITPNFSGFHAAIATSMLNEPGNGATENPKAWSYMAMYDNGPLFASLSHERQDSAAADTRGTKLGLGYKMGATQVGLVWEKLSDNSGAVAGDRTAYMLTAAHTMGNVVVKGALGRANDGDSAADTAAKQFTLGADYNFSKRTAAYALYSKLSNNAGASYVLGGVRAGGAYVSAAGEDPSVISLGMKHSF